jgi:GNAT superfamily N-acetyltransferase
MLFTGPAMARRLEAAEASHIARQVELYRQLRPGRTALAEPIAGGVAIATDPSFGRKLNHATGIGMSRAVTPDDLARIERLYAPHGLPTEIDLCPHAEAGNAPLLARHGYRVEAFSNTYARRLTDADLAAAPVPGVEVRRVEAGDAARFVAASLEGFAVQAHRRSPELLELLARIALGRGDTTLYLALVDGVVGGSAGLALIDTPDGPVAHLHIASTLPAHRGRGIQAALLVARLAAARRAGLDLASVGARPANTSARNAERAGFRLAYTKPTFSKPAA